ncbi:3-oxoacyl-ACP synthase [Mangrovimonas xylaniphaga]|uniref:3-oxoacyl-ACP synthase n=1 Tax=Mangrovimonas xylaniphaga TaxID=1645915 RepID=UPI0006B64BEC|nr:3-oxoacyl-ACP synthase [Mangrovimonas xylaniphaga]
MNAPFNISSYASIRGRKVTLNGQHLYEGSHTEFSEFIKAAYKALGVKYPKFFKMDNLSKLAFLTAEVLLKNENLNLEADNNIAIVLSNRASSLDTDRAHQASIQDKDNYYPSPAVFVYTLPNICIGEISIKYKLYSENSFFIFDRINTDHLFTSASNLLETGKADQVLCGWVDFDSDSYEAFLYLVSEKEGKPHTNQQILKLYNT